MPGTKELKTRIKSIQGMRKVTRAMQMVSAAKMRKAQNAVVNSRTYAALAWELVNSLEAGTATQNEDAKQMLGSLALLKQFPNAKKVGVILLTTNRGLVGSLNSNLVG